MIRGPKEPRGSRGIRKSRDLEDPEESEDSEDSEDPEYPEGPEDSLDRGGSCVCFNSASSEIQHIVLFVILLQKPFRKLSFLSPFRHPAEFFLPGRAPHSIAAFVAE